MRDTMRDGQKATRSASNRSKLPKEPLGRIGTTTSRPALTRAPSSMDATLAAGAAIDRHGTPMHQAITKPRESLSKPQPVRRPTRDTNPPPSPVFEDIDLEMQSASLSSWSTDPLSFGSFSTGSGVREKGSLESCGSEVDKYSFGASDEGNKVRGETNGIAGRGSLPPRTQRRGCFMGALQKFWEDWKEVNRLGGPSHEADAWAWVNSTWSGGGSKTTDLERSPRTHPAFELGQLSSGSNLGYQEQAQRAITPRAPTSAAARRGGAPDRHVLERRGADGFTEITTFSQFIDVHVKGAASRSGLRHEVRDDSVVQNINEHGVANRHDSARQPAFRIRTQEHQPPYDHRVDNIEHASAFDGFDGTQVDEEWDRQTRAPTMVSSAYGARMSHVDSADWKPVRRSQDCTRGGSGASSFYTTTTNGHPNPPARLHRRIRDDEDGGEDGDVRPSVPAIPGEYLKVIGDGAKNPWWREKHEPVSPVIGNGVVGDGRTVSPLRISRNPNEREEEEEGEGEYVPIRAEWSPHMQPQRSARQQGEGDADAHSKRGTNPHHTFHH
ncbi:hypothetical protein FKW77_003711 [Venturia effusa]|uniref:Uncharacterized protein n=1 Tax=Venturia effusa TaxID=50376 RepID=A0A517LAS7_9PEZI|nr:hypothetical protein FKW77_003711 [Venturia effusa]